MGDDGTRGAFRLDWRAFAEPMSTLRVATLDVSSLLGANFIPKNVEAASVSVPPVVPCSIPLHEHGLDPRWISHLPQISDWRARA